MNQPEFLIELRDLLEKHNVAIATPPLPSVAPGVRHNGTLQFQWNGNTAHREIIASSRSHLTAHDINGLLMQLKFPEPK